FALDALDAGPGHFDLDRSPRLVCWRGLRRGRTSSEQRGGAAETERVSQRDRYLLLPKIHGRELPQKKMDRKENQTSQTLERLHQPESELQQNNVVVRI